MQRKVDEPHGYGQRSLLSRFFRWLFFIVVALFAVVGLVATTLLIISWLIALDWTIADLYILAGKVALFTETHFVTGVTIAKGVLELVSLVLIAFAAFVATLRMPMLAGIIRDFITARGSIYTLQNTITDATKMVQSISGLEPTIELLGEKIDAAQKQLAELQRSSLSERTDGDGGPAPVPGAPATPRPADEDSQNWERLRALWYANTRRIEGVIDRISDGRRKLKYDRMPRTDYRRIITSLARDGLISEAAKDASINLHNTFTRYRPRNQKISDEAIGALKVFDELLEQEIGKPPADDDEPPPPTQPA